MTNSSMTALNKQALREAAQEQIMLPLCGDTSDASRMGIRIMSCSGATG